MFPGGYGLVIAVIEISFGTVGLALIGAFSLGVSKTGFPGLAMINVLVIAELFGARESVGIILPLLITCDLIVYPMFRKFASWRQVLPLLPPALVGLVAGVWLLARIDNATAKPLIGAIVLTMVAIQLLRKYKENFLTHLPDSRIFLWSVGGGIGISTMLANAAGPVYSVYALVHRMAKEEYLGVGARFFLLINVLKLPLLVFGIPGVGRLALINAESIWLDLLLIPGLIAGILLGRKLITLVPQSLFEWLLYFFSAAAGLRMLLG